MFKGKKGRTYKEAHENSSATGMGVSTFLHWIVLVFLLVLFSIVLSLPSLPSSLFSFLFFLSPFGSVDVFLMESHRAWGIGCGGTSAEVPPDVARERGNRAGV